MIRFAIALAVLPIPAYADFDFSTVDKCYSELGILNFDIESYQRKIDGLHKTDASGNIAVAENLAIAAVQLELAVKALRKTRGAITKVCAQY